MAVIVSDAFQRRGVGARLMEEMIAFAKTEKLNRIVGTVLFENRPMRKLFERHGFTIRQGSDGKHRRRAKDESPVQLGFHTETVTPSHHSPTPPEICAECNSPVTYQ